MAEGLTWERVVEFVASGNYIAAMGPDGPMWRDLSSEAREACRAGARRDLERRGLTPEIVANGVAVEWVEDSRISVFYHRHPGEWEVGEAFGTTLPEAVAAALEAEGESDG